MARDARGETLLELRGLTVEYGVGASPPGRSTASTCDSRGRDRSASPASPAAARRRSRTPSCSSCVRPRAIIGRQHPASAGEDLLGKSAEELRRFRWRNVSIVFQSAMNALNPVMRVGDQFVDAMRAHERIDRRRALARAGELLELVGIDRRRVRALPARAVRRHAPARDHRDGARARPQLISWTSRRPRSTSSCSARSCSRSTQLKRELRLLGPVHHARPVAAARVRATGSRSCTRARSSRRRRPRASRASPQHPYTQGLLALVPAADAGR